MKYKVGDSVRIESLDWYNENKDELGNMDCGDALMITEKSKFCGKIVTISNVSDVIEVYKIEEDNGCYNWTDEMIEGLVEEETKVDTALNPIEPKSNANCLTQKRVDEMSLDKAGQITDFEYEGLAYTLPEGYQFVDENGNVINSTKIVLEKKKKEYPKTYEGCCEIIHSDPKFYVDTHLYSGTLETLYKLLICRDAYWKIAGDEMGLDKPWEPDYTNTGEKKFSIWVDFGEIKLEGPFTTTQMVLSFPTAEMRDAFYENFKEEIEMCKGLL